MEHLSSSKVTVEYFDPHDVYKLLSPGLIPRLPLRNLHWQSHAGPLRSISTLHVRLVPAGSVPDGASSTATASSSSAANRSASVGPREDGFQAQAVGGGGGPPPEGGAAAVESQHESSSASRGRRHQIPGLRPTPYLKVLLVRCDNSDTYKAKTRAEIREWIKRHTPASTRKANHQENHDAFEWLVLHVVLPNTAAATQPRTTHGRSSDSAAPAEKGPLAAAALTSASASSLWRGGQSSTLLEKMRSDFNGSSRTATDRVAQVRIGINDVPYDLLPRVVPAVPTGYVETVQDVQAAWDDLIDKFKDLILTSFDSRVTQYEEDIKEKDGQRALPGWNFCTFFILKEGLARGFESVGLVEDALVGYDQLSAGLDLVTQDRPRQQQQQNAGSSAPSPASHGGVLLSYTEELKNRAKAGAAAIEAEEDREEKTPDSQVIDLRSRRVGAADGAADADADDCDEIAISSTRKPYRDLILANNVSLFDFRAYIFSRQIALLLRLANASSSREELLAKLREEQESITPGVAPRAIPSRPAEQESENLLMLAEVCRRTLQFIPEISHVMRNDLIAALRGSSSSSSSSPPSSPSPWPRGRPIPPSLAGLIDNLVATFAFSVAQQILAQTSTKGLPIPPTSLIAAGDGDEQKASIPEPKTMMHPARTSSLRVQSSSSLSSSRRPPSPTFFPGPGARRASLPEGEAGVRSQFMKAGLEDLAARRADLYMLSRNILEEAGKKRGWSDGWAEAPVIGGDAGVVPVAAIAAMEDISLDDDDNNNNNTSDDDDNSNNSNTDVKASAQDSKSVPTPQGIDNRLLATALADRDDFYRLYEILTDKALRHYTVASHAYSVQACMTDLAVLKFHAAEHAAAAAYFYRATPFFGETGWSALEISMLIMYARCLRTLQRRDEHVRVVQKVLSKAALAERERLLTAAGRRSITEHFAVLTGFLADLLAAAAQLPGPMRTPLADFFADVNVEGAPEYREARDGFSLWLTMYSLLVDELEISSAVLQMRCYGSAAAAAGPSAGDSTASNRDITLEFRAGAVLKPGRNRLRLSSNVISPGRYKVAKFDLVAGNVCMHYDADALPATPAEDMFRTAEMRLFQRTSGLDVTMLAGKHLQLGTNKPLDLILSTGWNEVESCEIRVRAATGGLRLLTADAQLVTDRDGGGVEFGSAPEAGLLTMGRVPAQKTVTIRFPYSTEQDLAKISIRLEVSFIVAGERFMCTKMATVLVGLALRVNVQDVFKHDALMSRFSVMTAGLSPLRLYRSELAECELFRAESGVAPAGVVTVFPREPACLLYRVLRKPGTVRISDSARQSAMTTMHLRLHYTVLQTEFEDLLRERVRGALMGDDAAGLAPFAALAADEVVDEYRTRAASASELERTGLLAELSTAFIAAANWEARFRGLGRVPGTTEPAGQKISALLRSWQAENPALALPTPPDSSSYISSVAIPVAIPSIPTVHTADIQLGPSTHLRWRERAGRQPVLRVNELCPATLSLRWSRVWDTAGMVAAKGGGGGGGGGVGEWGGREFSYEVAAPTDSWLVGGRKKGHFIIPARASSTAAEADADEMLIQSTAATEAAIPLALVPLREGWLPYPVVEIQEVAGQQPGQQQTQQQQPCEVDFKNIGEAVQVVGDRARVTVSLDASGPGGGPLVLESEGYRDAVWAGPHVEPVSAESN